MNSRETTRAVDLRADVVARVEARLPRTEFESTEAYVEHVLEEVLFHVETATADDEPVATVDEAAVKEQLRALGYADE